MANRGFWGGAVLVSLTGVAACSNATRAPSGATGAAAQSRMTAVGGAGGEAGASGGTGGNTPGHSTVGSGGGHASSSKGTGGKDAGSSQGAGGKDAGSSEGAGGKDAGSSEGAGGKDAGSTKSGTGTYAGTSRDAGSIDRGDAGDAAVVTLLDAGIATAPKPPLGGLVDMQDISWHDTEGAEPTFTMANVDLFPGVLGGIVINATWDATEPTQGGPLNTTAIDAALAQVAAYNAAESERAAWYQATYLWWRECTGLGEGHWRRARCDSAQSTGLSRRQLSAHHRPHVDGRLRRRVACVPHEGRGALRREPTRESHHRHLVRPANRRAVRPDNRRRIPGQP